jgi:hypothetical protein
VGTRAGGMRDHEREKRAWRRRGRGCEREESVEAERGRAASVSRRRENRGYDRCVRGSFTKC